MKTKRVYFNETLIKAFMQYATDSISNDKRSTKFSHYMDKNDIQMLADYLAARADKYSCDNIGQTFIGSEKIAWTPSRITFFDGRVLTSRSDIIQYQQEEFENDRMTYIEENLFNFVFGDIERILRMNYNGKIDEYDKRILNNARKYLKCA